MLFDIKSSGPFRIKTKISIYRPDIDGLRALAVLSVMAFHAFPRQFPGGFIGVDIFFVISGYLISTTLFNDLAQGNFRFTRFYTRRIRRIFPALITVLAVSFIFGAFVLLPGEWQQLGKHAAGGAFFVANLVFWQETGYFDTVAATKPLLHLWSLGVEEQFYLLWPLVLWWAWKRGWRLPLVAAPIFGFSLAWNLLQTGVYPAAAFYSPLTRFWELMAGALVAGNHNFPAQTVPEGPGPGRNNPELMAAGGLGLIITGLVRITSNAPFPGWRAALPVFGAMLLIRAGSNAWVNRYLFSRRLLVWLGLISYPLYLWHWVLLSFSRILGRDGLAGKTALLSLSVFLAWATFRFIEHPLRFGLNHSARRIVTGLLSAMFVLGITGLITGFCHHRQKTVSTEQAYSPNEIAFEWGTEKYRDPACIEMTGLDSQAFCLTSAIRPLKAALIGDSHANALYDFFKTSYAEKGQGLILLGIGGCPPFLGVERDKAGCPKQMQTVVSFINKNAGIEQVFIAGRFASTLSGENFGIPTKPDYYHLTLVDNPAVTSRETIFYTGLERMITALQKMDKKVTVLLDYPELDFDPKHCLSGRGQRACQIPFSVVQERQASYTNIIRRIRQKTGIRVIDPKPLFCRHGQCTARADGYILYRDSHHLGVNGSRYLLNKGFRID